DQVQDQEQGWIESGQQGRGCHWSTCGLGGEPGAAGCDERLHAGLERRMYDRSELWIVVGRQLAQPALALSLRVGVGVDPADEPEHRRHMPLCAERAEVLAGGSGTGVNYAVIPEVGVKRGTHPLGGPIVVAHEVVAIEGGDLGWPGSPGRL